MGSAKLDIASRYLDKARARSDLYPAQVASAEFLLDARLGKLGDVDGQLGRTPPAEWWRILLVVALATARQGDLDGARQFLRDAERELIALGFSDFDSLGERRAAEEVRALVSAGNAVGAGARGVPAATAVLAAAPAGRHLVVMQGPITVVGPGGAEEVPAGNPQRLVGAVIAYGGSATFDQLSEAIWPGEDVEVSRARLRNVLLRLRRGAGDVIMRSGSGVRLAPDVTCDLHDFERLATDALASARADPEMAGVLATDALKLFEGYVFSDFEYEEWAIEARRAADNQAIALLDLLSVQAEDSGDLPLAQSLAERALRLDRYTDSRYVRLAELMAGQGRNAAAVAVLEDAAAVARELGGPLPGAVRRRRDHILRQAAGG